MVDLFSRMGDVFWVAGCLPLALIILYIRGCLHQGAKLNSAKEDICCSFYFSSKLFFLLDPPYPASSHANFPPPQRGDWTMISFALPTLNKYIYIYINKFNLFYTYLSYSLFIHILLPFLKYLSQSHHFSLCFIFILSLSLGLVIHLQLTPNSICSTPTYAGFSQLEEEMGWGLGIHYLTHPTLLSSFCEPTDLNVVCKLKSIQS